MSDIDALISKLKTLSPDIKKLSKKALNQSVHYGENYAKKNSPVKSGIFRDGWISTKTVEKAGDIEKSIINRADYASYVNYGHRLVDRNGNTKGYVFSKKGDHLLERTCEKIQAKLKTLLEKEVESLNDL